MSAALNYRTRDTLEYIAKEPRRVRGLTYRRYWDAQSLFMQGLVSASQMESTFTGQMEAFYSITEKGKKALNDIHGSGSTVPPTKPAA